MWSRISGGTRRRRDPEPEEDIVTSRILNSWKTARPVNEFQKWMSEQEIMNCSIFGQQERWENPFDQ